MRVLYRRNSFDTPGAEGKLCHHWQRRKYRQEESLHHQTDFLIPNNAGPSPMFQRVAVASVGTEDIFFIFFGCVLRWAFEFFQVVVFIGRNKRQVCFGGSKQTLVLYIL